MTLSLGIKNRGQVLIFTDCMVSEFSQNGEYVGATEALKLSKIYDGIFFSMVGDAGECKRVREVCRGLVANMSSIEEAFNIIELFFKTSKFDGPVFEFLITSRHKKVEASLYYFRSNIDLGLIELNNAQYSLLGSATDAVSEKVTNFIKSSMEGSEKYCFKHQFPRLLGSYLNQWCIGDNVAEGYKTFFGSRILYLHQDGNEDFFQPTSITLAVLHSSAKIKVRMFMHFWDKYGLVLYDSYKHQLNYLIDDNCDNLRDIPKGEELFKSMREIYSNFPHTLYQFIFIPDTGSYNFFKCKEFKFIAGEEHFSPEIQEHLNKICSFYNKNGEVIFGE